MSSKTFIYLGLIVGSVVGGYVPTLFGVDLLSAIPVITSSLGAALGVYICYKLTRDW